MNKPTESNLEKPAQPQTGRIEFLRRYGVPLLLTAVACHQFYRVHADGLSSWRGGGFGMYGGYHPRHNDVWWTDLKTGETTRFNKQRGVATKDGRYQEVRPYLTYVNEPSLRRYHRDLPEKVRERSLVEVWQLDFDPDSGRLGRRLLISAGPDSSEPNSSPLAETKGEDS